MASFPLIQIKGVGAKRAALFENAGITDGASLLTYLPASFRSNVVRLLIDTDPTEPTLTCLTVQTAPRVSFFGGKRRALRFVAGDESASCEIIFFYQTYLQSRFVVGQQFYFYGRYKVGKNRFLCFSPEFETADKALPPITPIYPLVKGLSRRMIVSALDALLPHTREIIEENLPPELLHKTGLIPRAQAVLWLHRPETMEQAEAARRRFAFEELYFFRLDLLLLQKKRAMPQVDGMHPVSLSEFWKAVGFHPTQAQNRAIAQIFSDLIGSGHGERLSAMHRLLQGDVGSGKTVVCAAAIYLALKNGKKAALLAPTELLANQHYEKLSALFSHLGFECHLLCGSSKVAERRRVDAALQSENSCLVIGTHALIAERVAARDLSLVVIDEQHRFGVRQRDTLLAKAEEKNLLVMSATPIPRTLALFLFSPQDVSVLDELPPGRKTISTFYIGENKRERADGFIRKQLEEGARAYIVCPLIEENEESDLMAAESRYEEAKRTFSGFGVGFLHGKMSSEKKRLAMEEFACGKTQVLVSTTVIEIGIDVPEATVMCIENAERFGLSTLHQLRGRVGRGERESYCILISSARSPASRERLKNLCENSDGFKLAQLDMQSRGPGDFFGVAQSGKLLFSAAKNSDEALLRLAAESAQEFFEKTVDN